MAEHQHAKATWRERLGEILLEIGIIVFAITLSIQLHSWHEHALDREAEHKFLTGLRQDLRQDLLELRDDSLSYLTQLRAFRYFRSLTPQGVSRDSLHAYAWTLRNTTGLIPNSSRFEGIKSAGRLDIVADDELLSDLLDHYQEQIPGLLANTTMFSTYKRQYMANYLDTHLAPDNGNLPAVMASLPMQNYLDRMGEMGNILYNYHQVMQHSRKLITAIDRRLKE